MAQLTSKTTAGKPGANVELDASVFEAPVRAHLLHAEVRRQLAARRRGTHATKNRHAVSGGGIKPWRQKGTGRARQGSIRAPQWAGGGVVFGPVPRGHGHALPKKARAAALRAALSQRLREEAVVVVDDLALGGFKTRRMQEILAVLGLAGQTVLIVSDAPDPFLERSARNLPGVSVVRAEGLNVYDVLRHAKLLFTRAAVAKAQERLAVVAREVAP